MSKGAENKKDIAMDKQEDNYTTNLTNTEGEGKKEEDDDDEEEKEEEEVNDDNNVSEERMHNVECNSSNNNSRSNNIDISLETSNPNEEEAVRARELGREALLSRNYPRAVRLLEIASRLERGNPGRNSSGDRQNNLPNNNNQSTTTFANTNTSNNPDINRHNVDNGYQNEDLNDGGSSNTNTTSISSQSTQNNERNSENSDQNLINPITRELLNSARAALARENAHIHQARQREAEERHPVPEPTFTSMLRSEIFATPIVLSRWVDQGLTFLGYLIPGIIYQRLICRYIHVSFRKSLGLIFCIIIFLGTVKYYNSQSRSLSRNSPLQYASRSSRFDRTDYPAVPFRGDVASSQRYSDDRSRNHQDYVVHSNYPYDHSDPRYVGENRRQEDVQNGNFDYRDQESSQNQNRYQRKSRTSDRRSSMPFTYPGDIYYHNPDSGFTFYSPIVSMFLFSFLFRLLPMILNIQNRRMNGNNQNQNPNNMNQRHGETNADNNYNQQRQGNFQVHIGGFPFFPFMNFRF